MRSHRNRWLLVAVASAALLILLLRPSSTKPHEVSVSFVSYTNVPGSSSRFALFSIINDDRVSIRHRGISVEMEGDSTYKAPVTRPGLPRITATPLGSGREQIFAVGVPSDPNRWRVRVQFSRNTLRERFSSYPWSQRWPLSLISLRSPLVCATNSAWLNPAVSDTD